MRQKATIGKLEKEKSEREKDEIEIEDLRKRLEDLEYGAQARSAAFAKNMWKFRLEKNRTGEIISMLWYCLSEMRGTEEEKQQLWKRVKHAVEHGEKFDTAWMRESKGLKWNNLKGITNTANLV